MAVAGGFLLLGVVAALLAFQSRWAPLSSTKGARMSRFSNKRSKREHAEAVTAKKEQVEARVEPEPKDAEAIPAAAASPEPTSAPAPPEKTPETAPANDAGRFGEHVETVLRAAEDAAARMIKEARAEADQILEAAKREAASRLDAAQTKASGLQAEAEQARAEALSAASEMRAAAQDDAARQRAQVEEEAAKMRADAEREASSASGAAAERYDQLLSDTALAEDRLRRLVGGLRDVADRLDGLLVAPGGAAEATDGNNVHRQDSTLVDTLDPNKTKAGVGTR